jgi:hypothetical protein
MWLSSSGAGSFFKGLIKEIIIWTNNVNFTNGNSATTIANVHNYCTNIYGYTP